MVTWETRRLVRRHLVDPAVSPPSTSLSYSAGRPRGSAGARRANDSVSFGVRVTSVQPMLNARSP